MQPEELGEFLKYLDGIIAATKDGNMNWQALNPTTYVWKKDVNRNARIVVQRVQPQFPKTFVFQLVDNINVVQINEQAAGTALATKLEELYDGIGKHLDRKGLNFLKSILPSP
jgi:hypothetical protein